MAVIKFVKISALFPQIILLLSLLLGIRYTSVTPLLWSHSLVIRPVHVFFK